jgi:hypothetical protein
VNNARQEAVPGTVRDILTKSKSTLQQQHLPLLKSEAILMTPSYENLVSIFKRLGAQGAEDWARSEVDEGSPQLLRFLVLRGMWKGVLTDGDSKWMEALITSSRRKPDAPLAGVGAALERLLAIGADPSDLNELVRGMQYETLFGIAYLLDDPITAWDDVQEDVPELEAVRWGLWEEDDGDRPTRRISGLHESALQMDPTGREMRPKRSSGG